jgi:8-hydroxy-5-deazaflavin:NADPH oxidoreductase
LPDILGGYADKFAGKTVVDITHPANLETFDSLLPPPESSSAAELATALPSSQVIKAFNSHLRGHTQRKASTGRAARWANVSGASPLQANRLSLTRSFGEPTFAVSIRNR